jgi:hypothetical protein
LLPYGTYLPQQQQQQQQHDVVVLAVGELGNTFGNKGRDVFPHYETDDGTGSTTTNR